MGSIHHWLILFPGFVANFILPTDLRCIHQEGWRLFGGCRLHARWSCPPLTMHSHPLTPRDPLGPLGPL